MEGLIITFLQKNDWEKAIIPMKAQDIPNSNPEPSKQWKHHSTRYQIVLQRAATRTRTGKYSNRLKWDMNTKNKSRPLQSNDPPSKEQKLIYQRKECLSNYCCPPLKKKITQYLSLCTEIATKKGSKT